MFGYMIADTTQLNTEERKNYRSFYCGLCDALHRIYGNKGRKTLSYDLTFVNMLLCSVYHDKPIHENRTCPLHPFIAHSSCSNSFSAYCANMNILLTYYKLKDDYTDTGRLSYQKRMENLSEAISKIEEHYPRQFKTVQKQLELIGRIEKDNILDPDLGANAFGLIMAEIFSPLEDEHSSLLKQFGYHMGRFIYLMDAVLDLKEDLRNQNYNPLVRLDSSTFESMLMMVGEQCDIIYKKFDFAFGKSILDNIFYSGIWSRYRLQKSKERLFK